MIGRLILQPLDLRVRLRVWGLGFGSLEYRGLGLRVYGLGFRGLEFRGSRVDNSHARKDLLFRAAFPEKKKEQAIPEPSCLSRIPAELSWDYVMTIVPPPQEAKP